MRIAVAEAFAARQHFEPLAARAADVALYPILMRGLGGQPATVDTLKRILSFPFPDEPSRQHRRDAVSRVLGRLTADQYIAADDAIVMSTVTPEFRLELLTRWLALPADQIPSPVRTEIILRAARLQTALGQYPAAHHTLEMLNGVELTPELRQLRFTAAVKAGMYDRASEFESQPEQWIVLLSTIAEDDQDAARALQAEIDRRFDGKITGELAATYESLRERLAPENENDAPPEAGSAQAPE